MKNLFESIDEWIPGDWGTEIVDGDSVCKVSCMRGADIVPILETRYANIPTRYISKRSFEKRRLKIGDIVVEKSGGSPTQSTGRIVFLTEELLRAKPNLVCSNFCEAFRVSAAWNSLFVFYYVEMLYKSGVFFNFEGKTSGLKNLDLKAAYSSIVMPYVDLDTQRQKAYLLQKIDRLIELSRKRIGNFEKLAKEIYDYWFVQFDFPDKNGRPYKTSGGKMIYNAVLKREIPEGWEVKKFGDLICISEGQVNPQKMGDQLLEHYSIPAYDDSRYPVMENASSILSNKFKVTIETFLVSKLNPQFKRLWDPVCVTDDAVCSTEFIVCRSKDELNKPFNYGVADSEAFQLYMRQRSSSSTGSRKRLDPKDILDFKLAMPLDDGLLDKFNKLAGNCLAMIKEPRKGIHELTQLREFLLPLLMNGQAKMKG